MKKRIFALLFGIALIIGLCICWIYRHPKVTYDKDGKVGLKTNISYSNVFNFELPSDIANGLLRWEDEIAIQYYYYQLNYEDINLSYETYYEQPYTYIHIFGTAKSHETGQVEEIDEIIKMKYHLYNL